MAAVFPEDTLRVQNIAAGEFFYIGSHIAVT
jgi:hypothetical protein